jgi:hypothetical protein
MNVAAGARMQTFRDLNAKDFGDDQSPPTLRVPADVFRYALGRLSTIIGVRLRSVVMGVTVSAGITKVRVRTTVGGGRPHPAFVEVRLPARPKRTNLKPTSRRSLEQAQAG